MTIKLSTVGELTNKSGVKILIYSKPKIGKTSLIKTCPNPVVISAERGLLSLRRDASNIPAIEIKNMADFEEVKKWATESAEAKRFDTIALDSISEIAEVCLVEEKEKSLARAIAAKKKEPNGFEPFAELKDQILAAFRAFRDYAPKHVYFTAQEIYDKDPISGMKVNMPAMPGRRLENAIPYMFDEIFQLVRFTSPEGQPYNAIRTRADDMNYAGDRSGALDYWEPADISRIIEKIQSINGISR